MAKHTRFDTIEPLHIFQDDFFDHSTPMISHAPMPSSANRPRRPLQQSDANVVLNPPNTFAAQQSPFKSTSRNSTSPLSPLKASQGSKLNMVSFMPPTDQYSSTDSMQKKQPLMSRFKTVAQKPTIDQAMARMGGKENAQPTLYPAPPTLNISIENYYQKAPGKRLLEPATIKDARPQKKVKLDDGPLPPHNSFPLIHDDGTKPGHSYAMLIGMAILRSPHRRLTLSQIYKWISDTYSFYHPSDAGWQNSIRHNLSLNKAFIKQERPKDDPGKGNYWAIEPGMEHTFMKEKPSRKASSAAENLHIMSTVLEPAVPIAPILPEPALPPQLPMMPDGLPTMPTMQPFPELQPELSSDATIPISDTAALEDQLDKAIEAEFPVDSGFYSPIPAAMHSSPPIPRHVEARSGTPPPVPRVQGSSATRSHKRKFASMDDSGYISSLESSALRSNQNGRLPNSEADRPRMKRGRAEEEIARLRASSYDSPTKGRSWKGYGPPSSSPLRHGAQNECTQMLPPLTPALKLKAPPKPPPSASPNTDLRIHRDKVRRMLDSPLRRVTADSRKLWGTPPTKKVNKSPNRARLLEIPRLEPPELVATSANGDFEIFQDESHLTDPHMTDSLSSFWPPLGDGTEFWSPPVKMNRFRLDRTHSASALSDLTNSTARRSITSNPLLKVGQSPALAFDTPSRCFDGLPSSPSKFFSHPSPSKLSILDDENAWINMDDFCNADLLPEVDEFGGLDILQGFEKIGAATQPARPSQKPAFGRSYTSTF